MTIPVALGRDNPCHTSAMDPWQPTRYERFAAERRQPWDELLDRCEPVPGGTVVDLGCGTGRLTAELPDALGAHRVIGVDSSPAMLDEARRRAGDRLRFEAGDLTTYQPPEPLDLVIANASLQWVDDHEQVLTRWRGHLRPGGQLAVQVPANGSHPANALVAELTRAHADWFPDGPPALVTDTVLAPEAYAGLLWRLGATEQWVALRVYPHELTETTEVVEWLEGTTLNRVRQHLADDDRYRAFVDELRDTLVERLGQQRPYLFTFNRILLRARFP
jgi:trans-aconitate 2-methyltransferase